MDLRTRLYLAAFVVLLSGLLVGAAIYLFAADEPADPTAYVIVGDTAYPVDPTTSKAYVRQLERFGGKAAVLFDEWNRWFAGLWRGKQLGITIASLGAFATLVLFAAGRRS